MLIVGAAGALLHGLRGPDSGVGAIHLARPLRLHACDVLVVAAHKYAEQQAASYA